MLKEADPHEGVCPSHLTGCFHQRQSFPSSESARNCLQKVQLGLSSGKNEPEMTHTRCREVNGPCCCSRKCFFHGARLHSSANSRKGQVQLPSATGVLAFPDLPAVRVSVNMCCCRLPQRHEWRHSRPRAPFQNLPRSSSVPTCVQHCWAAELQLGGRFGHPPQHPKWQDLHNALGK